MARSLRWRLQAWHALTLVVVVACFGAVLYYQVRQSRLDEIDGELHAAARALEGTLRGFPPHLLQEDGTRPPPPHPPPDLDRGPKRPPPPGKRSHREHPNHPPQNLVLPEPFRHRHEGPGESPYFAVWRADGTLLQASFRPGERPPNDPPGGPPPPKGKGPFSARQHGPFREGILPGPHGTLILVGRRIDHEHKRLAWLAGQLLVTGIVVLGVGLAGGWLLSRGAVRPLERMSAIAAGISASNLAQRIDLADVDNELGSLAGTLNDMFDRLQTAFERQARFTADASHELRTPLSIIHSQAELALTRPRSADEYRTAMETCLRATRRMRNLVDGMLTLARIDAGNLRVQRQPIDLDALVQENIGLLDALAERKDVHFRLELQQVQVPGDSGQLSQVITNLLTNAILYNRQGGEVVVALQADEQQALLRIADTGFGIPEEDRGHLFERFYRVDKARSREQGGCGLGLAICKSIVEAHGGSIGFTSEMDCGTTFFVSLPRQ